MGEVVNEAYRDDPRPGFPGQVADQAHCVILSRTAEAAIPFGRAVVRGTAANSVRVTEAGDTEIAGFAVRSQGVDAESPNQYPTGDNVGMMVKGPMWLTVTETVAVGDPVYVTVDGGAITKTAAAGRVQVAGAEFETAATSGNVAKMRII